MKQLNVISCGLAQMCRLCLSQDNIGTTGVFLFSSVSENEIADIVMECAPVKITRHDKMPRNICQLCFTQLKKFHEFRMQIIQSDKTLQRYLQQLTDCHTQIKVEWTLEQQSDTVISQNCNTVVNTRGEPFESSDEFNICNSNQNLTRNNEKMPFKLEVKDESIDGNSLIPTECADDAVESVSKDERSGTHQRYLQQLSVCYPQIEAKLALEEPSNDSVTQNYNTDVTTNCEPSEISDKFGFCYSKQKVPLKSEIKDEPMEDNSLIPIECTEDVVENVSNDDGSGIRCEVSMIVIDDTKVGVKTSEIFEYSLKFENDMTEKLPLKIGEPCNTSQEEPDRSLFPINLRRHRSIHTGEKPYKCDICKLYFRQAQDLKSHKLKHTGEKPYQCDVCQMCFRLLQNLKIHKVKHTGEKPYQCDICKMCFSRAQYLKKHKLKHTGEKPYQCDICKMYFRHSNSLRRHVLKHTGEKPYRCDICHMGFIQSGELKSHKLKHTGEKPYQCDICHMYFRHSSTLKRHKLKHTGEKPYQCDICQMCFRQTVQLKSHKLKHAENHTNVLDTQVL